ncbi:hypothetical protein [Anaeromassilibacillus sp. SJQ-1]|uniref:hypothetical protein n=1 Tax=Anaeromassilibacillus sp. SJQ-1 TaxID=3375419 RepID=UPI00129AFDDA
MKFSSVSVYFLEFVPVPVAAFPVEVAEDIVLEEVAPSPDSLVETVDSVSEEEDSASEDEAIEEEDDSVSEEEVLSSEGVQANSVHVRAAIIMAAIIFSAYFQLL